MSFCGLLFDMLGDLQTWDRIPLVESPVGYREKLEHGEDFDNEGKAKPDSGAETMTTMATMNAGRTLRIEINIGD